MFVTLITSAAMLASFGLASLGVRWVPVDAHAFGLTAAAAIMLIGGYHFLIMAMRVGEVGSVAPFRYTGLIRALVLGWVAFGEWRTPVTFIGAGMVVGSGLFTLFRESRVARDKRIAQASRAGPRCN